MPNGPSKAFQKHTYQLINDRESNALLIHYIGDENAAVLFPQYNSKIETPFVRTCPSSYKKFAEMCESEKAGIVYKKEVSTMNCHPEDVPTQLPQKKKQLRNLTYKHLHNTRISKDELYSLHQIVYDIPGFVWKITSYPDLVCVCGLQELLEEADKVLFLKISDLEIL